MKKNNDISVVERLLIVNAQYIKLREWKMDKYRNINLTERISCLTTEKPFRLDY